MKGITKPNYELEDSITHCRSQREILAFIFLCGKNSGVPDRVTEHTEHKDQDSPCQKFSEDDQVRKQYCISGETTTGSVLLTCHPCKT